MTSGESLPVSDNSLRDVERISGGAVIPSTRDTLEFLVEAPLLAACQEFYDKNIRTINSSANRQDVLRGFAYINIDCNTLSKRNREIADGLGMKTFNATEPDGTILEVGGFHFPVTESTTQEELSRTALELAQQFELQPMRWARPVDIDFFRKQYPGVDDVIIIIELQKVGYFYDPISQKAYHSKEHYLKTKGLPIQ